MLMQGADAVVRPVLALQHSKLLSLQQLNQLFFKNIPLLETRHNVNSFISGVFPDLIGMCEADWEYANEIIEKCFDQSISIIPISSDLYPVTLKVIPDPPPVIYAKGDLGAFLQYPCVSVVGARKATKNGLVVARRLAEFFVSHNWTVVSGLALGIDAAAHEGALQGKGRTIAVLASGLDQPTPKTNEKLAFRILEMGGAWLSEHPVGVVARPEHFPKRNRIQVGLSAGSIIVECAERSGTATQASYGIGQGRAIYAVIPDVDIGLDSSGPKALVKYHGALRLKSRNEYSEVLKVLSKKYAELTGLAN